LEAPQYLIREPTSIEFGGAYFNRRGGGREKG